MEPVAIGIGIDLDEDSLDDDSRRLTPADNLDPNEPGSLQLDSGHSRLFDLEKDAEEKADRSGNHPEQARWYAQDLRNWSAMQKHLLQP